MSEEEVRAFLGRVAGAIEQGTLLLSMTADGDAGELGLLWEDVLEVVSALRVEEFLSPTLWGEGVWMVPFVTEAFDLELYVKLADHGDHVVVVSFHETEF